MSRQRKLFIHGMLYELGFRTEEGLPFPPIPLIKYAVEGIIARAQALYGVHICSHILMSNHFHLLIVVEDPAAVPQFVAYIKRETAHMVNHLLGRRRKTVWLEGYDSVPILDPEKAIQRFIYTYTNPTKANLEDTIDKYPNSSSWELFLKGGGEEYRYHIPRDSYPVLPEQTLSLADHEQLLADIIENTHSEYSLVIEPDLWLNCFSETRAADAAVYKQRIIDGVRTAEDQYRRSRTRPVLGTHALRLQSIRTPYMSKKWGKKMICLSSLADLRKRFIKWFQYVSKIAEEVSLKWKDGDFTSLFPPGFFLPGGNLSANINPALVLV